jgi:hypothetical protein
LVSAVLLLCWLPRYRRVHTDSLSGDMRSDPSPGAPQQQMGGVGLVFYRDNTSPYLVVKDVVHDGPSFRSSLIYPGDKLCCINDFDLAWSEKTPRNQQPQLPGPHGSAVTLTFDRSVDVSYPERFTITLIRNMAFYPGESPNVLFFQDLISLSPPTGGAQKNSTAAVFAHILYT